MDSDALGGASTAPAPPAHDRPAIPHDCMSAVEALRRWITALLLGKTGTDGLVGRLAVLEREHALAVQSYQKDMHNVQSDMREIRREVKQQAATAQRVEAKMDDVIRYVREGKIPTEFLWFMGGAAGLLSIAFSFSTLVPLLGWWVSSSAVAAFVVGVYVLYVRIIYLRKGK